MSVENSKNVTPIPGIKVKSKDALRDALIQFDNVNTAPTTTTGFFYLYVESGALKFDNGSSVTTISSGGGGGIPSWETIYSNDATFNLTSATWTITQSAAADLLTLTKSNVGAGAVLAINNSGSGNDITGTSSTWSVSAAGAAVLTGITMGDNELITMGDGSDATIGWNGSVLNIAGVVDFDDNVTLAANATITQTGVAGSTVLTITAGDAVMSDGSLSITDADNAETVTIINNTATTIGAAASAALVQVESTSLTTGAAVNVQLTEGTLNGGFYYSAWDATAGARVFSVAEDGALTVAGAGGSAALTLTAGDAVMSDGSLSITDADNAETVTVINNTATTIGASASAGIVQIESTSLTTGAAVNVQLTEGTLNGGYYYSAWDATAAARVFSVGEDGAIVAAGNASGTDVLTLTAGDITVTSGDVTLSEGSVSVTNTANETVFTLVADSVSTGIVVDINADGLTSGTILHIDSTVAGWSGGLFIDCFDGAASAFSVGQYGALTVAGNAAANMLTITAGDMVMSDGSISVTDADDASTLTLVNDSCAAANLVDINADGLTSGYGIHIDSNNGGNFTTGGYFEAFNGTASVFTIKRYGATVIAGNAGTDVLTLTAGHAVLTSGNLTLTSGNAVLTAGNLTLTSGDLTMSEGKFALTDTADERAFSVTGNVTAASQAVALIKQDHTTGATPVIELSQDDADQAFILFTGTAGAGNSLNTNTTSGATTHHIQVEINGTTAWIAASTNSPS